MHPRPSSPARQLGSVCARYRDLLSARRRPTVRQARRFWTESSSPRVFADDDSPRDVRMQRVEAVLLLAREPLSSRKLSQFAGLDDGTQARTLVRRLNGLYDEHGRAFRVEEVAGGFQLLTRPKFAPWLRRLGHIPVETRLSAPAMETLAVVAYRQPVLRADIEAIRGVNCGEILRQLMDRDLIRVGGRSEELGRPYLYGTTRRFLQIFGLRDPADLPRAEMLRGTLAQATATAEDQGPPDEQAEDSQTWQTQEESDVKVTIPVAERFSEVAERFSEPLKKARRKADEIEVAAYDDDDEVDVDDDEDLDDGEDGDDLGDDFEDEDDDDDWDDEDEDEDFDDDFDDEDEDDDEDDDAKDAEDADEEDFEDDEWEEVEDDEEPDEDDEDEDDWDDDEDEDDDAWEDEEEG